MDRLWFCVRAYLRVVPVEAALFEVPHCSLVAAVPGELRSFMEDLFSLQRTARHLLHHVAHGVGHLGPDLNTRTKQKGQAKVVLTMDSNTVAVKD